MKKRTKNQINNILKLFLIASIFAFVMGIVKNRYTELFLSINFDIISFVSIFGMGVIVLIINNMLNNINRKRRKK